MLASLLTELRPFCMLEFKGDMKTMKQPIYHLNLAFILILVLLLVAGCGPSVSAPSQTTVEPVGNAQVEVRKPASANAIAGSQNTFVLFGAVY